MRVHGAQLPVEVTRAESGKFHHPLLLLHGLWTGSWIWRRAASYLAHRGWESWAPSLLAGAAPTAGHAARVALLEEMVRGMPAAPVIVAHDSGVVTAAHLAVRVAAAAVVAVAPLLPPADAGGHRGLFAWPRFWRARLIGARVAPPRHQAARAFAGDVRDAVPRLRADSASFFRALAASRVRLPGDVGGVPGLVVCGDADTVTPPAVAAGLAGRYAWAQRCYPGRGHFLMLAAGSDEVAAEMHRWLVRALGAELLALLEEDEPL